jgi:GT2 family glycosyltransferase
MDAPPRFSIIVLNWNSGALLQRCLAALRRQTERSFEVICVDNGSSDCSAEWLRTHDVAACVGAAATTIVNTCNTGFAAGMNTGIRAACGQYVVPLNVDVVLADDFLAEAAVLTARHPQAAALGGIVFSHDDAPGDTIISTGMWLTRHLSVRTRTGGPGQEQHVFGPTGCCPIFARAALDAAALMPGVTRDTTPQYYDEVYFAYGEDVDLYLRLQLLGYTCVYSPRLRAWHTHSGTQAGVRWFEKTAATIARTAANQVFTWLKNCPPMLLARCAPYVLCTLPAMCAVLTLRRPRCILAPLGALPRILRYLPRMMRIRHDLQRRRRVGSRALAALFM